MHAVLRRPDRLSDYPLPKIASQFGVGARTDALQNVRLPPFATYLCAEVREQSVAKIRSHLAWIERLATAPFSRQGGGPQGLVDCCKIVRLFSIVVPGTGRAD
jgi:hypothetical protein